MFFLIRVIAFFILSSGGKIQNIMVMFTDTSQNQSVENIMVQKILGKTKANLFIRTSRLVLVLCYVVDHKRISSQKSFLSALQFAYPANLQQFFFCSFLSFQSFSGLNLAYYCILSMLFCKAITLAKQLLVQAKILNVVDHIRASSQKLEHAL